ncbi:putative toxin-antitoxin system, antitoxin component [delta proteobacterium NaphS2]|nr:putative toxin-antitoxin system, antitoxin component [delta proteobacterium NaphS2]
MKYNLELLKADVQDELAKIEKLAGDFRSIENKLDLSEDVLPYYDCAAIGYYLHSFYNGCENIFRSVARFFENDLGADSWHSDLLKRMKLSIPGYRPAVIDEELYRLLNDFRAFRHIFRHSYSFELDWEKERLVAKKLQAATKMFRRQIGRFLTALEDIEKK